MPGKQKTIQILSGQERLWRSILKEVLESNVEMVELMTGVDRWEQWEVEPAVVEEMSKRSQKEERRLWRMLDECDKEQAKEEERKVKRERKKVQQARTEMKVGNDQY